MVVKQLFTTALFLSVLSVSGCTSTGGADLTQSQSENSQASNELLALTAGGNLVCYGGKNGSGRILNHHMNSAHNCCQSKKQSGKSWTCPTYNGGKAVNCTKNNNHHCK